MTSTRNTHAASIILPLNEHSWAGKPQRTSFSTMELYSYGHPETIKSKVTMNSEGD